MVVHIVSDFGHPIQIEHDYCVSQFVDQHQEERGGHGQEVLHHEGQQIEVQHLEVQHHEVLHQEVQEEECLSDNECNSVMGS